MVPYLDDKCHSSKSTQDGGSINQSSLSKAQHIIRDLFWLLASDKSGTGEFTRTKLYGRITHNISYERAHKIQETARLIQVGYRCTWREARTVHKIVDVPMHPKVCKPRKNQTNGSCSWTLVSCMLAERWCVVLFDREPWQSLEVKLVSGGPGEEVRRITFVKRSHKERK